MDEMEQLAVLSAIEKAVNDRIKEVRDECNAKMLGAYDSMGAEKIALKACGAKVGDMTVTFDSDGWSVTDREAFEEFALDYGLARIERRIRPEMEQSVIKMLEKDLDPEVYAETVSESVVLSGDWEKAITNTGGVPTYLDTGLAVPGLDYRPKTVKGTMVRGCKPADVFPMISSLPGGINGLLLGDGGE